MKYSRKTRLQEWREQVISHHSQSISAQYKYDPNQDFWRGDTARFRDDPFRIDDPVLSKLSAEFNDCSSVLDVGGGASKEKVSAAFKILLSDKNVKGILINIFGGIMRCDVIAQGILDAAKKINLSVPLVVRLAGTNVELGKEILKKSDLKIISAKNLSEAAQKIVEAVR